MFTVRQTPIKLRKIADTAWQDSFTRHFISTIGGDILGVSYDPSFSEIFTPVTSDNLGSLTRGVNGVFDNPFWCSAELEFVVSLSSNLSFAFMEELTFTAQSAQVGGIKKAFFIPNLVVQGIGFTNDTLAVTPHIGELFDLRPPILAAMTNSINFTYSYDEAVNCFFYRIPFVFFFNKNQREKILGGGQLKVMEKFSVEFENRYRRLQMIAKKQ